MEFLQKIVGEKFVLGEPTWTDQGGRHSSPRSMFVRLNYKLGNGSDHNNAKKYGPCFVNPYWVGLEKHCFFI